MLLMIRRLIQKIVKARVESGLTQTVIALIALQEKEGEEEEVLAMVAVVVVEEEKNKPET